MVYSQQRSRMLSKLNFYMSEDATGRRRWDHCSSNSRAVLNHHVACCYYFKRGRIDPCKYEVLLQ